MNAWFVNRSWTIFHKDIFHKGDNYANDAHSTLELPLSVWGVINSKNYIAGSMEARLYTRITAQLLVVKSMYDDNYDILTFHD